MSTQIFARELNPDQWQWSSLDADDSGDSSKRSPHRVKVFSGSHEHFMEALPNTSANVNLVVRGQHVVSTEVALDAKQKRHAAKLIPYELEDELSSSVDDLHFSFGELKNDSMPVLYTHHDSAGAALSAVDKDGVDVKIALPDYLMIDRPTGGIVVLLDHDIISVRITEHWGFTVEPDLADIIFKRLAENSALSETPPNILRLVAKDKEHLDLLASFLPEVWRSKNIEIERVQGSFWDCVDHSLSASPLNLRIGKYSSQLPFKRWIKQWQTPLVFFGIAFVVSLVVNFGGYYSAKSKQLELRKETNNVYLQAVPGGRLGDPERNLKNKIKALGTAGTTEASNAMHLVNQLTLTIAQSEDTTLLGYSYSGDKLLLQMDLEFPSLEELSAFRAKLDQKGISSDSPRTSAIGNRYQAKLAVREAE